MRTVEARRAWRALPAAVRACARSDLPELLAATAGVALAMLLLQGITVQLLPVPAVAGSTASVGIGLVGLALLAACAMFACKLALGALRRHAGIALAPDAEHAFASDGRSAGVLLLLLVLALPPYLALVAGLAGIALVLGLLMVVATPAVLLEQALAERWLAIPTPARCLHRARALGADYPRAVALVAVSLPATLVAWTWLPAGRVVAGSLLFLSSAFAVVVLHAFIGEALRQRVGADAAVSSGCWPEEEETLARVATLRADGATADALALLRGMVRRGASDAVHARYLELGTAERPAELLGAYFPERIASLVAAGRSRDALACLERALALDADFVMPGADDMLELAAVAARAGRAELAHALAAGFVRGFPRHERHLDMLVTLARMEVERQGRVEQGVRLLESALAAPGGEARRQEITTLLAQWRAVLEASPRA